jgi:hypothetical protein
MRYKIQFKPRALKDIEDLPSRIQARVLARIEEMSDDLKGDVKRLTDFTPEYCALAITEFCLRSKKKRSLFIGFGTAVKRTDEGG